MEFLSLASSSAGCCYLVKDGNSAPLMIDAGIRYQLIQEAINFKATSLAGCLVSHSHGDHCVSAARLMSAGVDCYASRETWQSLKLNGHRAHAVEPRQPFRVGEWVVQAFEAVHDAPGTLGFVVSSPRPSGGEGAGGEGAWKLLYLTDSAYSPYRFSGLTHIAIECNFDPEIMRENTYSGTQSAERYKRTTSTHMSLPRLIDMLKANDLTQVEEIILLHLSDANSNESEFKIAIERATGKLVRVAQKQNAISRAAGFGAL